MLLDPKTPVKPMLYPLPMGYRGMRVTGYGRGRDSKTGRPEEENRGTGKLAGEAQQQLAPKTPANSPVSQSPCRREAHEKAGC